MKPTAVQPVRPGTSPDDQPPPGADDGLPVGSARPHGRPTPDAEQVAPTAVPPDKTHRYFGDGPWNAIASAAAGQSKCAGLTTAELQAMVLTTIFRESGGATSAGSEPAPMTLSRYDEWTGVRAGNTNINANYGLYAFRDPYTAYKRVFWHPGIGIWQYDSAGIGAPYTAAERISTAFLAPKVAADMAGAYCSSTQTTDEGKRYDAWYPWYLSCDTDPEWSGGQINPNATYCEEIYQGLMQTNFGNVTRTAGISAYGGEVQHTCALNGVGTYPCWLVDPTKAQGSTWWATMTPLDGGAPNRDTSPATPISTPFYVIKRNGVEQRYWLGIDSGYGRDITGTRVLGKNARPKDNQSGSGVTWSFGSGLCDKSLLRGSCDPNTPPAGVNTTHVVADGPFTVVTLDADGNGLDDIFYYRPRAASWLWLNRGRGTFTSIKVPLNGSYQPIPGDYNGDGREDLYLYSKAAGLSYLLLSDGRGGFGSIRIPAPKGLVIKTMDRNANGKDELVMYAPGAGKDAFWEWNGKAFVASPLVVGGHFQVLIGDWDGNGYDDILFYAPGPGVDYLRLHGPNNAITSIRTAINGDYRPAVGDFDGDKRTDIFWYGVGAIADSVWFGAGGGRFVSQPQSMGGSYWPVVSDVPKDGRKDLLWYGPRTVPDYLTRWTPGRNYAVSAQRLGGTQTPVVGRLSAGGGDGILWYGVGSTSDWVWWQ